MANYKVGDIVLIKSIAGDCIPNIHVRLVERIVVKPVKGKRVGIRMSMDWPGYSGWEAEVIYQDEIDNLRKNWSIPFTSPGEITFVFDSSIIKKPRKKKKELDNKNTKSIRKSNTITRRRK